MDPEVADYLYRLRHHSDPAVRRHAVETLGNLRDPSAVPDLLQMLERYGIGRELADWQTRWRIVKALGQIGDSRVVPALCHVLEERREMLRRSAAEALGQIGDVAAVPALLSVLRRERGQLVLDAVVAVGKIGDRSAVPDLIRLLQRTFTWRPQIVAVLGRIGGAEALATLIATLQDPELCPYAAAALGHLGDPAAVPALAAAWQCSDSIVRRRIEEGLVCIGPPALEALVAMLRDGDPASADLVDLLGPFGEQAAPLLLEVVQEQRSEVRCSAIRALGKFGDASTQEVLKAALQDPVTAVRWEAAYARWKQGDPTASAILFELFKVRAHRIEVFTGSPVRIKQLRYTLWRCGFYVVPALLEALRDEDAPLREAAARLLGSFGSPDRLAREILAWPGFTVQERVDLLEQLRERRDMIYGAELFRFPGAVELCRQVLTESEPEAREGAFAVLNHLTLLRGAQTDPEREARELVRSTDSGRSEIDPGMLLRAADISNENEENALKRRPFWKTLWRRPQD